LQVMKSLKIGSLVKNKQHLHSRHPASYLAFSSEGVVQAWQRDRDFQNKSTQCGASGRDS
jgi:hypothetical protein